MAPEDTVFAVATVSVAQIGARVLAGRNAGDLFVVAGAVFCAAAVAGSLAVSWRHRWRRLRQQDLRVPEGEEVDMDFVVEVALANFAAQTRISRVTAAVAVAVQLAVLASAGASADAWASVDLAVFVIQSAFAAGLAGVHETVWGRAAV